jgi:hypothetical protein
MEVGQAGDGFSEGDDVIDGHVGAALECRILLEEMPEGCDDWDVGDAGMVMSNEVRVWVSGMVNWDDFSLRWSESWTWKGFLW